MSGLIVGLVIRTPISDVFVSTAKYVAIIYADHAWEDGTHAYPAVDTVANAMGVEPRTVQRHLRELERIGMLVVDGKGPRGTNKYKFPLVEGKDGSVRLALVGGDIVSPRQIVGGDIALGDADSGDTGVTRINQPSDLVVVVNAGLAEVSTRYEQEFGSLTPMIADAIKDDVDTFTAEWVLEAMDIAVKANVRRWNYVHGILKACKAKNVKPSLNRLEKPNANGKSGARSGKPTRPAELSPEDVAAAERINARSAARV